MDMLKCFLTVEVDQAGQLLTAEQCRNHKLFAGGEIALNFGETKQLSPLEISKNARLMKYQGQFPVISLGLKEVEGSSYEEIEEAVKEQIVDLYAQHMYLDIYVNTANKQLINSDKKKLQRFFDKEINNKDLTTSLRFLSMLLSKHFGKPVYILLDEYDTPINSAYLKVKDEACLLYTSDAADD